LSVADIEAALNDGAGFSAFERTLMNAVAELVSNQRITDATYTLLAERYTPQQLLDLVFTVGNYTLMCMTTNTFDVQVEPNVASGWKPS
jgi:4-carboxymuconolactone decarboxylase